MKRHSIYTSPATPTSRQRQGSVRGRPLPEVEQALESGSFLADPHRFYRRLREHAPVYWSPYLSQWLVTSFDAVEEVLRRPRVFSNFGFDSAYIDRLPAEAAGEVGTLRHHFRQRGLIQADPPEHTQLRRALAPHFSAKLVARLDNSIATAVADLLAGDGEHLDIIADLAGPLPVLVIAQLLGVGDEARARFPLWSGDAVRFFGTPAPLLENARRLDADLVEWRELVATAIEERRGSPADDLLTVVANLVDAGSITLEEGLFTCVHLLIAGHETTTNLIGNAVHCLVRHPEALALVSAERAEIPGVIEEVLRYEPPIQRIRRVAAEETELFGAAIMPGQAVIPVLAAANRDPARFPEPDRFDPTRSFDASLSRHLAFGHGVHFCLGAPLARMEAPVALEGLLDRFPAFSLPDGFEPVWKPTLNMRGLESLPIVRDKVDGAA